MDNVGAETTISGPYREVEVSNAFQLAAKVASGVRPSLTFPSENRGAGGMQIPSMPHKISELMVLCWDADARRRPSFGHILNIFEEM